MKGPSRDMKYLQAEAWKNLSGVIHGFGFWQDKPEEVRKKDFRGWSLRERGRSFPLVSVRQVHGDQVVVIREMNPTIEEYWEKEGDSLLTRLPGLALGVFTADCLPILLFDPLQRAIGAVHAGWRGTAKEISQKAVKEMISLFHCRSEDLMVALGPCIGPCCYEIDEPVRKAFSKGPLPWNSVAHPIGHGKWLFDLQKANQYFLKEAGIQEKNITSLRLCTRCEKHRFFSYRGEGDRGRQLSFIALRNG